jgi:hypothetical protein
MVVLSRKWDRGIAPLIVKWTCLIVMKTPVIRLEVIMKMRWLSSTWF